MRKEGAFPETEGKHEELPIAFLSAEYNTQFNGAELDKEDVPTTIVMGNGKLA